MATEPKRNDNLKQTTVSLPKELDDRLRREARRRVLGKSRLVELILSDWMERNEEKDQNA